MVKALCAFVVISVSSLSAQASGIILHLMMAKKSVPQVNSQEIKSVLEAEKDAFYNGIIYPDAGLLTKMDRIAEFSHKSSFFNAYMNVLLSHCSKEQLLAAGECRQWFAHLLGTVMHSVGDVNFDRYFVTQVAKQEFDNSVTKAQAYTDVWLDSIGAMEHAEDLVAFSNNMPMPILKETYQAVHFPVDEIMIPLKKSVALQYWIVKVGMVKFAHIVWQRGKTMGPWASANYVSAKGGIDDTASVMAGVLDDIGQKLFAEDSTPVFYYRGAWPINTVGVEK